MVKLLTNAEVRSLGLIAGSARVTDLLSEMRYNIFWGGPPTNHTDFSPLTPLDTAIMKQISDGWSWRARPAILHIDNNDLTVGVHHFPHGSIIGGDPGLPNISNIRPATGWEIGGHFCMYYKDSTGGTPGMTQAARYAYELMSNDPAALSIQRFDYINEFPEWARPELQTLVGKGILQGSRGQGRGLDMTLDMARVLILSGRMHGVLDEQAEPI